jgi:hypothetical protein
MIAADRYFEAGGPPSSPPITFLLTMKMMKQTIEVERYIMTEKARSPAGTSNVFPSDA